MSSGIEDSFEPNNIHISCDELCCSKDKTSILFGVSHSDRCHPFFQPPPPPGPVHYQYHHNPHHHLFATTLLTSSGCSTASTTSSASASSTSSSRADSISKADFHIVGGKIRPTLKCIRNTLNLGIDSKRYDRLSSSKSDLHLTVNELSVDDTDVSIDFETLPEQVSNSNVLNNPLTNDITMLPSSTSSQADSKYGGNSNSTMLLPSTNTFRSFIKTKSSGIIIRKDTADKDDEEAEQLCESDSTSKISNSNEYSITNSSNEFDSSVDSGGSGVGYQHLVVGQRVSCPHQNQCQTESQQQQQSRHLQPTATYPQQTPAEMFYAMNQTAKSTAAAAATSAGGGGNAKTNNGGGGGGGKRHPRHMLIPPILKPNRLVKHTKGNLLFNVNSGGKSGYKSTKKRISSENLYHNSATTPECNSREIGESLKCERMVMTQPEEDRRRRTIIIEKVNNSFGFTLQTYGIKHSSEGEVELITYVDEVTYGGPAFRGGMRPGDVILSINGRDVEKADHRTLVNYINSCEKTMRLVVLFEDCVRKIELNLKYIKLKKVLQQKMSQLEILNQRESQILLNAALRGCSQNTGDEQPDDNGNGVRVEDKENCHTDNTATSNKQLKYKCKSLNVSLNDIDCSESNDGGWVDEQVSIDISNNNKQYSNIGPEVTDTEQEDGRPNRSKSLPQSKANSLDCLTNEAYEDDENLLPQSPPSSDEPKHFSSKHSTGDKDFITKL